MGLFDFFKKKSSCCCGEETKEEETSCCGESSEKNSCCCDGETKDESCCCGEMCKPSEIEAKKREEELKKSSCCCGESASVKVLGSGCAKCNDLEAATKIALENLGMDSEIEHVKEFSEIAAYGVMSTPALVVDGKVVSSGKSLTVEEVEALLKKVRKV